MINKIILTVKSKMANGKVSIFSLENKQIELISDNVQFINCAVERLMEYFPQEINGITNKNNSAIIKIYVCQINEYYNDLYNVFNTIEAWKQKKHMNGYYYNANERDYDFSIWINKNHSNFGDELYTAINVMNDFKKNNKNILLLFHDKLEYYYFYFECNDYVNVVPMRIIRSLFMYELVSKHDTITYYHSAVIQYKNKGVLLCGASGNGKTSVVLNFMDSCDGELVANDKTFLYVEQDRGLIAYGWPTVVTIGVGSLRKYENLKKFLLNIDDINCSQELYGYKPNENYLLLKDEELKGLPKEGNKLALSHTMFADLFKKKIVPTTKIDTIIYVNLHWNFEKEKIKKIVKNKKKFIEDNLIDNLSDQLEWLGKEKCESRNINKVVDYMVQNLEIYSYEADFKSINSEMLLKEVL